MNNKYSRYDFDLNITLVKVDKNDKHDEYYFITIPSVKNSRVYLSVAEYEYLLKISGNKESDN